MIAGMEVCWHKVSKPSRIAANLKSLLDNVPVGTLAISVCVVGKPNGRQ
jgi:hypothetical protein